MAWKSKKEKALSREEAVALAKNELASYWFGSLPLLAGVYSEGKVTAHPLDPRILEKPWLIFLAEPTDVTAESCLVFAKECNKRYGFLGLECLVIFKPKYESLRVPDPVRLLIRKHQIPFPAMFDHDGLLSMAFLAAEKQNTPTESRGGTLPKVVLLDKNRIVSQHSGSGWATASEPELQRFLRSADPGLALLPLFQLPQEFPQESVSLELGSKMRSLNGQELLKMKGKFLQETERVVTSDPGAKIKLKSPSERVGIVAQTLSKTNEPAKMVVEVNEAAPYEAYHGENLASDEEGQSIVRIEAGKLYSVLTGLAAKDRDITFSFPGSNRVPVALYGLRLSD